MGILRVLGLIFFMTILVGGCVIAVNSPPPPGAVALGSQITWDEAVDLLNQGQVVGWTQTLDLHVYLYLRDGTQVLTQAPSVTAISDALYQCGTNCAVVSSGNV